MELILPSKLNETASILLETSVLVIVGANGAGKSSFGRDLLERYAGIGENISGMRSLFIRNEEVNANGNELTRL
ncbi:MAG: ABC transporter ATP-binding protein, partial [Tannerellaceae bacterium]